MGFADNLNWHPTVKASPLDSCVKKFINITIEQGHLDLLKNNLTLINSSNQNKEAVNQQHNDVRKHNTPNAHNSTTFSIATLKSIYHLSLQNLL